MDVINHELIKRSQQGRTNRRATTKPCDPISHRYIYINLTKNAVHFFRFFPAHLGGRGDGKKKQLNFLEIKKFPKPDFDKHLKKDRDLPILREQSILHFPRHEPFKKKGST